MFASLFPELDPKQPRWPAGLTYRAHFIDIAEESDLMAWIDEQPWETELSRRRQFHGGEYDTSSSRPRSPMPMPLARLAGKLFDQGLVTVLPDRCLINEYLPGQGIAAHVDHHPRFGDEVVMISLLDGYPMVFAELAGPGQFEQWLARRSVCVIKGEARYRWTHEIVKRKADLVPGGGRKLRGRRVSVTFRKATNSVESL